MPSRSQASIGIILALCCCAWASLGARAVAGDCGCYGRWGCSPYHQLPYQPRPVEYYYVVFMHANGDVVYDSYLGDLGMAIQRVLQLRATQDPWAFLQRFEKPPRARQLTEQARRGNGTRLG
jgi:hypothetical protein